MSVDLEKARRERIRWLILVVLDKARPVGAGDEMMLSVLDASQLHVTEHELHRELDYLEERALIKLHDKHLPAWRAELTRTGIDVAEYTVEVEPGIGRPSKYW